MSDLSSAPGQPGLQTAGDWTARVALPSSQAPAVNHSSQAKPHAVVMKPRKVSTASDYAESINTNFETDTEGPDGDQRHQSELMTDEAMPAFNEESDTSEISVGSQVRLRSVEELPDSLLHEYADTVGVVVETVPGDVAGATKYGVKLCDGSIKQLPEQYFEVMDNAMDGNGNGDDEEGDDGDGDADADADAASVAGSSQISELPLNRSSSDPSAAMPKRRRKNKALKLVGCRVIIETGRHKGLEGFVTRSGNGYYAVELLQGCPKSGVRPGSSVMKRSNELRIIGEAAPSKPSRRSTNGSATTPAGTPRGAHNSPALSASRAAAPVPSTSLAQSSASNGSTPGQPAQRGRPKGSTAAALAAASSSSSSSSSPQRNQHSPSKPQRAKAQKRTRAALANEAWIQRKVYIKIGKGEGEIGVVTRSGHGFYCVEVPGSGGEYMKRAIEMELLDESDDDDVNNMNADEKDSVYRAASILLCIFRDYAAAEKPAKLQVKADTTTSAAAPQLETGSIVSDEPPAKRQAVARPNVDTAAAAAAAASSASSTGPASHVPSPVFYHVPQVRAPELPDLSSSSSSSSMESHSNGQKRRPSPRAAEDQQQQQHHQQQQQQQQLLQQQQQQQQHNRQAPTLQLAIVPSLPTDRPLMHMQRSPPAAAAPTHTLHTALFQHKLGPSMEMLTAGSMPPSFVFAGQAPAWDIAPPLFSPFHRRPQHF